MLKVIWTSVPILSSCSCWEESKPKESDFAKSSAQDVSARPSLVSSILFSPPDEHALRVRMAISNSTMMFFSFHYFLLYLIVLNYTINLLDVIEHKVFSLLPFLLTLSRARKKPQISPGGPIHSTISYSIQVFHFVLQDYQFE